MIENGDHDNRKMTMIEMHHHHKAENGINEWCHVDQELIFSKVVGDDDMNSQRTMLHAGKTKKKASSFSIVSLNSEVYFKETLKFQERMLTCIPNRIFWGNGWSSILKCVCSSHVSCHLSDFSSFPTVTSRPNHHIFFLRLLDSKLKIDLTWGGATRPPRLIFKTMVLLSLPS